MFRRSSNWRGIPDEPVKCTKTYDHAGACEGLDKKGQPLSWMKEP